MKLKGFLICLFFILNVSVTLIADASHIDFSASECTDSKVVEHSKDENHGEEDHCTDHSCCHQYHSHHLIAQFSIPLGKVFSQPQSATFSEPHFVLNQILQEIVKPPVV